MRKKVLFITRKWPPAIGGMETYCVELARALANRTDLTTVALPGQKNGAPPSPVQLIIFGIRAIIRLCTTAKRFDVIHGADMALWPLIVFAQIFAPQAHLVLSAHGTDIAFANRPGIRALLYRYYLNTGARLLKRAIIIANSHATAALLAAHGFKNAKVIPLAAQTAEYHITPPSPYLLFVGRLTQQKGCRWFGENVLPQLPQSFTLCVAGTIVDKTEAAIFHNPRVTYLGPVFGAKLKELRRSALAVIVPNIETGDAAFEGFGLAATEASADGGLTLAADFCGLRDAVVDGQTGFLLPVNDAPAWAAKIHEIAGWSAGRREDFLYQSTKKTAEFFSWGRVACQTLSAYG